MKYCSSASVVALMVGFGVASAPAASFAQAAQRETAVDEVVVTGSSIRGVAAVGSNLVSRGQADIRATAPINANQLLNSVPAITTSGSAPQGEVRSSYYTPSIHALGASASNATLAIIDGMRIVGGGTQWAQADPNIVPITALERVEVLADGASSVYGSDAVAGVINFITRKTFNGLEVNGRYGIGDAYSSRDLSLIAGTTWDRGGIYIAASHARQSNLAARDRDFYSRGDYRDLGGTNTAVFNCSPATIRTPASGTNIYLSPSATSAVPQVANNAPCNNRIYGNLHDASRRTNFLMKATFDVTDRLNVTGTVIYNRLYNAGAPAPGTLSNITVFGPGSGMGGQINPFFKAPAGDPNATRETINWLNLVTPRGLNSNANDTVKFLGVIDYDLGNEWSVTSSSGYGHSRSYTASEGVFCSACAILALNGTPQSSASLTTSAIGGINVISTMLPLTTANALDVWNPAETNRTSAAALSSIYGNATKNVHYNKQFQTKLEVQGPILTLPAGEMRAAFGGEFFLARQDINSVTATNVGTTARSAAYSVSNFGREVYSAYAELSIPLVAPGMDIPLVQEFDVNLSGRYDKYSDVGSTTNPKIAANWKPFSWLKLRGNWSTAFVAPPVAAIGDPSQGGQRGPAGASLSGVITVPVAIHPTVRQVPGADCTRVTTCDIGLPANQGLTRAFGGIVAGVVPATGEGWSVGGDVSFPQLGMNGSVTLFHNKYRGGVNASIPAQILNTPTLSNHVTICPTGCTPAQIAAFTRVEFGARLSTPVPSTVYFMYDTDIVNLLNIDLTGIDYQVSWRFPTDSIGTFRLGTSGTLYTQFDQNFGGGRDIDTLGVSGYNPQFPTLELRTRSSFGWDLGGLTADVFVNYTPGYRNWSAGSVTPIITDASGPIGGGDKVKSDVTVDTTVSYEFQNGILDGSSVYLNVVNLFDRTPPFFNDTGYNLFVTSAIGRVASVGFRAKF